MDAEVSKNDRDLGLIRAMVVISYILKVLNECGRGGGSNKKNRLQHGGVVG